MPIEHTITGLLLPQTRTAEQVLADMETTVRSILFHPVSPPCPELLIAAGSLRYAYEPAGRDDYLGWWDWPMVPMREWQRHQEHLWEQVAIAQAHRRHGGVIPAGYTAIDDCDGFSTHAVAWHRFRGRRAWPLVQTFRSSTGQLRGWHALAMLELAKTQRHPAEIPYQPNLTILDVPWPATARPGYRLAILDLSWLAGMPRGQEGRFDLSRLRIA